MLRDVYKLSSTYASGSTGGMIDLSDSTISRLSAKLASMKDLKVRDPWCQSYCIAIVQSAESSCWQLTISQVPAAL